MFDTIFEDNPKKVKHKDKKAFSIFLLKHLQKTGRPIPVGQFFFQVLPDTGIEYFKDILDEMVEKKWVIKKDEFGGYVENLPFHEKRNITYAISIDGIDYLSSRSPIKFAMNIIKNNIKVTISLSTIIGMIIWGSTIYSDKHKSKVTEIDTLKTQTNIPVDSVKTNLEIK